MGKVFLLGESVCASEDVHKTWLYKLKIILVFYFLFIYLFIYFLLNVFLHRHSISSNITCISLVGDHTTVQVIVVFIALS